MVHSSSRINPSNQDQREEVHLGNHMDTTKLGTYVACGFNYVQGDVLLDCGKICTYGLDDMSIILI